MYECVETNKKDIHWYRTLASTVLSQNIAHCVRLQSFPCSFVFISPSHNWPALDTLSKWRTDTSKSQYIGAKSLLWAFSHCRRSSYIRCHSISCESIPCSFPSRKCFCNNSFLFLYQCQYYGWVCLTIGFFFTCFAVPPACSKA